MGLEDFEKIEGQPFMRRCKTCGEEVPTGIINISSHWVKCTGKGFYEDIMANPPKTIKDVEDLQKKHLNT